MKKTVVIIIILILALFYIGYRNRTLFWGVKPAQEINSFEECAKKYSVMESYPRQCRVPGGRTFVEEIDGAEAPADQRGLDPEESLRDNGAGADQRGKCIVTGCSGQVCADHDVITTCEFLSEYACYRDAVCERQPDGQCGWTETKELKECLSQF